MVDAKRTIAEARELYQNFDDYWKKGRGRARVAGELRRLARRCEDYWLRTGLLALARAVDDPNWHGGRIRNGLDGLLTNAVHQQAHRQKQEKNRGTQA